MIDTLAGLGVLASVSMSVFYVAASIIGNRWFIGLRVASAAQRRRRIGEWVLLPLVGYLLAVVATVGTNLLSQGRSSGGFVLVLVVGAVAVVVVGSIVAIRPQRESLWSDVGSWEALEAEVDERLASSRPPTPQWLADARACMNHHSASQETTVRSAARADHLLRGAVAAGSRIWWGLGVVREPGGRRVPVPLGAVARRGIRDVLVTITVVFALGSFVTLAGWPLSRRAVLVGTVLILVVLAILGVGVRSSLVYHARLHHDLRASRSRMAGALGRREAEVAPCGSETHGLTTTIGGTPRSSDHGRGTVGCMSSGGAVRLRLDDKRRATLTVSLMQDAGLEPGSDLVARADGTGRIVLESPEAMLAALRDRIRRGKAARDVARRAAAKAAGRMDDTPDSLMDDLISDRRWDESAHDHPGDAGA